MDNQSIITILDRIYILEIYLGELYRLCSKKWIEDENFWVILLAQETFHAENVEKMKKIILKTPHEFKENKRFSIATINSIIQYITDISNEIKSNQITRDKMLIKAMDIENSLIESNYQDIVITKNVEYLELVQIIIQQTETHKKMVIKKIAS